MKASSVLKRTLSSYPTYKVIAWTIIPSFPCTSSAAQLVQLDKRLSAERHIDVAGSNTGWTNAQGLDICKWLDILDFSNKDEQPKAPSHSSSLF